VKQKSIKRPCRIVSVTSIELRSETELRVAWLFLRVRNGKYLSKHCHIAQSSVLFVGQVEENDFGSEGEMLS